MANAQGLLPWKRREESLVWEHEADHRTCQDAETFTLHTLCQGEEGEVEAVTDFVFSGSKIHVDGAAMKLKDTCSLEEMVWQI